jgi:hypothetical protein
MARYEIPKQLPEFVECGDAFVPSNEATVEQWRRHKNPDNSVDQILKLAKKIGLPDSCYPAFEHWLKPTFLLSIRNSDGSDPSPPTSVPPTFRPRLFDAENCYWRL